jgi:hypothetical protein
MSDSSKQPRDLELLDNLLNALKDDELIKFGNCGSIGIRRAFGRVLGILEAMRVCLMVGDEDDNHCVADLERCVAELATERDALKGEVEFLRALLMERNCKTNSMNDRGKGEDE